MNAPISHRPTGLISLQDDEDDEDVALVTFGTFDNESPKYAPPPKEARGICHGAHRVYNRNQKASAVAHPLYLLVNSLLQGK